MDFRIISRDEQMEILTESQERFSWGHFYPATSSAGVGARMILDNFSLGYVSGRVAWMGKDEAQDKVAADKCVEIDLAGKLYAFIRANGISQRDSDIIFGEMDGYRMLATPNGSHGYVYMSFWAV